MAMDREYFTIKLTAEIDLGVALADMTTAVQFETKNICAVPGVPEFWYGVVNYQGGLLWILDSDRFFMQSLHEPCSKYVTQSVTSLRSRRWGDSPVLATLGSSASCGETPALDSSAEPLAQSVARRDLGAHALHGGNLRNGLSRKTALHRFFERSDERKPAPKLTAIIVRNQFAGDRQRVAIVTSQLKGIVAVEPTELSSLADEHTSRLYKCCSAVVHTAAEAIYLIDSTALLQEIHR